MNLPVLEALLFKKLIKHPQKPRINYFHRLCSSVQKDVPRNLKGKSKSSQEWLTRHINDPYVKKSRYDNYRARSAYKLIQIDDRYLILKPGQCVVECGAAPGAWSQVVVERINAAHEKSSKPKGTLVSVDLLYANPIKGATFLTMDFTCEETQRKIKELVRPSGIDIVLSDMAPNATGISDLDQENISHLIYSCFRFTLENLRPGGTFLFKMWSGYRDQQIEENATRFFGSVKRVKPDASRDDSKEIFLLCRNFTGAVKSDSLNKS